MDKVIDALADPKAKVLQGTEVQVLRKMKKARKHALHGEWDKIDEAEARHVLGVLRDFIDNHLA